MRDEKLPRPLELAKIFRVPQIEIAVRLGCTPSWIRVLARDPRHARRIRLAELEAILETERARQLIESAVGGGP